MIVFSVVMGICILASFAYVLSQIMHRLDSQTQAPSAAAAVTPAEKYSGLQLPAGAQIMQIIPNGAQLVIWARVPGEGERLILVDTRRAQPTGEMRITYNGQK